MRFRVKFFGLGLIGLAGGIVGLNAFLNWEPTPPGSWVLGALSVWLVLISTLSFVLVPVKGRYYRLTAGTLEFPRWGGLGRGSLPLSKIESFRRQGRDGASLAVVLYRGGHPVLPIPESNVSSPSSFLQALRDGGVREESPKP